MTSKAFLFYLLTGDLCAGQSVLTTPADSDQTIPGSTAGGTQAPVQAPLQAGQKTYPYTYPPGSGTPAALTPTRMPAPSRIVGPLTTKSEFQMFAEDATGRPLPVYGRQLFDEVPTTFAPVEHVPVPADYVLGPGDELLIRVWGKIGLDSHVTVDRNGQIYLPRVGTLTVSGLRYAQVEGYLHSAISALFKDFELNVTLGQLRSIQIYVLGNARQPGGYTVSSLSTLVDALFSSGGPSATGTIRRIQLRRGGQTLSEFDLYDLMQKGDKSHDVRLLPGDVIFIPPIGPQIAISGDVNQSGIYELKGETTVEAALKDAGGMTSLADAERVVLERIESHTNREVEEFALDASGQARILRDGDLLRVFPISPKFKNAVTLRGNVAQPGLYSWKEGMRVSDLIPSRDFLVIRDFWNRENHLVPRIPFHPFGDPRAGQYRDQQTASPAI
jgi:protein involved in polysaccharide export with SLBB domain